MAERRRIGDCLFARVNRKGHAAYCTWWRDQDDTRHWKTFPTIEAAISFRDSKRAERATLLQTPKQVRDIRKLGELLNPDECPQWMKDLGVGWDLQGPGYDADEGLVQVHSLGD
jgi:hypothetical protein